MGITPADWAREHSQSKGAACQVLYALASAAGDACECEATIEEIAKWTRLPQRSVFRALNALEEMGEIAIERAAGKVSTYRFCALTPDRMSGEDDRMSGVNVRTPDIRSGVRGDIRSGVPLTHGQGRGDVRSGGDDTTSGVTNPPSISLKTLTTDDDDLTRSSSSSSLRPQKRKAPPADDGAIFRLGLWSNQLFSARQLRNGAWHLAAEFGLHGEWAGFERWLETEQPINVLFLLQWLAYYGDKGQKQLEYINNLTGVLRKHVKEDGGAPLNASQVTMLERYCSMPLPEEISAANDERYKRQSPAWVEPQEDMAGYLGMWK